MAFTEQDVKQLLQEALKQAQSEPDKGDTTQEINQNRSQYWVKALAEGFKKRYEGDSEIRVFSKTDPSNRRDFGLNELLHDVVVCRVDEVPSAKQGKNLLYIKDAIWQVESEFARDSRQALLDFNKLVLGSAHNKLFIGPQVSKVEQFITVLKPAAMVCTGNVYVALITHPAKWNSDITNIKLWSLNK